MSRVSRASRITTAVVLALSLSAAACGSDSSTEASTDTAAAAAPAPALAMTAATTDGGQFEFGSLEGQDAVLWFWAPW